MSVFLSPSGRGTDSLRKGALGHDTCLICRTILPLHAAFADRDRRAAAGPLGALATFGGTSIPFSLIAVLAGRYIREHASSVFVKSYKAGMAPVAVGLLFATAYLLLGNQLDNWRVWAWAGAVTIIVWKTHVPLILLIMIGGVMGLLGCF